MSRNKNVFLVSLLSVATLASCSTSKVRYPKDYDEELFPEAENFAKKNDVDIEKNDNRAYYTNVLTTNTAYSNAVDRILLAIAGRAHNATNGQRGTDVSAVLNDSDPYAQVYGMGDEAKKSDGNNLKERAWTSLMSLARGGSYSEDNTFYESRLIRTLQENMTLGDVEAVPNSTDGYLLTPFMTAKDVFNTESDQYAYYFRNSYYPTTELSYLTAEYIYDKSYSSIGATNARNVQVVALEERSDKPNYARNLLNAYIRDYIRGDGENKDLVGTDKDFSILAKLWKGITEEDVIDPITDSIKDEEMKKTQRESLKKRYSSVILDSKQRQWLIDNGIFRVDQEEDIHDLDTLSGKVIDDLDKLKEGEESFNKIDNTLYSSYTGSYTYDINQGLRKAVDDIATKSLVTRGVYLKADGLSSLPETLKNRVFDSTMTTSASDLEEMKKPENYNKTTKDALTVYEKDGYRYLVNPQAQSDNDKILYYDSSSKTYYLVRILDVASSSALNKNNEGSMYTDAEKELWARKIAYQMSSTSTYKTDSYLYWLRRTNITYSDDGFLDYMKSTYKDLFKKESSIDSEDKIDLSDIQDYSNNALFATK